MSLCLTMIVRNESGVVTRLLDSVHTLVDYWVVCDTGSSDDTPTVIESYFRARGIPGELHHHTWKNFGHNRTRALRLADGKADYLLLLDADMVLCHSPEFDPAALTADSYLVRQDAGDLSWYNIRLVRSGLDWTCVGPTHEYYASPRAHNGTRLDTLWIRDHGDGGCKADKFERDIDLLEEAVGREPENSRYRFYLAESYRNAGQPDKALVEYERRIRMGGWDEETWYAMTMRGETLAAMGRTEEAKSALRDAHGYRPWRAEALLALVRLMRESGDHAAAVSHAEEGRALGYPENDSLFIDRSAHDWRFDHELTISAFHAGRMDTGREACERLLARRDLPAHIRTNVLQNLASYVPRLSDLVGESLHQRVIETSDDRWRYTNPSICCRDGGGYWLNLRQVDYRVQWPAYTLRETGDTVDCDHPATTGNVLVALDEDLEIIDDGRRIEPDSSALPSYRCHALGYEDGRLFGFQGSLWLSTQAMQHSKDGLCRIHLLKTGLAGDVEVIPVHGPQDGTRHEKNWMPFVHDGALHYVYLCDPLTVGRVDTGSGRYTEVSALSPPVCCEDFRGGSQGIPFDDGYLFVVHQVTGGNGWRGYMHRFVAIDPDLCLSAVSDAFCLDRPAIEFVAGLAADPTGESLVLSWGSNDERALLTRVSADAVRGMLRPLAPPSQSAGR